MLNALFASADKMVPLDPAKALPGRAERLLLDATHYVNGRSMVAPFPAGMAQIIFAMGCYWCAERKFWHIPGVWVTAVGNSGGITPNPTYKEVCSGLTGHAESVLVVYDPKQISLERLLAVFWEGHDPTQVMRQGNDVGPEYRSAIYWTDPAQKPILEASRAVYQKKLSEAGYGAITTEIVAAGPFYYSEQLHQQYLAKNPDGYSGLGGTGVSCPIGLAVASA